jgi:hypothetical protein
MISRPDSPRLIPKSYLIIGCGHFGSRAVERLQRKDPHSRIIVVDQKEKAFRKISSVPVEPVVADGISYLYQFLSKRMRVDYIIPAIPVHVAFAFLLQRLKAYGAKRGRVPNLPGLPNAMMGKAGDLYTSLANFLCPDTCPEPSRYCTVTRKRRQKPLYDILGDLKGPFESRVIISKPLALGVGGFQSKMLLGLLDDVKQKMRSGKLLLVSTASRCHGVTSALSF